MPIPLFMLALLAPAAEPPVTVTGHVWAAFISPMGEPFRPHGAGDDTLADWFNQADRNRDGALTLDEMQTDAGRFFATLDTDRNGEIDPDELIHYEWEVAPDIQVNSKTRRQAGEPRETAAQDEKGGQWKPGAGNDDDPDEPDRRRRDKRSIGLQGASRYALLNIPEPVAAADTDFNRGITASEFREAAVTRFQLLDTRHEGRLTLPDLEAIRTALMSKKRSRGRDGEVLDPRIGNPLPAGN